MNAAPVCVYLCFYEPSMLFRGRNIFILVDSYFGKLLPLAHFYCYLFIQVRQTVGLRRRLSVFR